MKRPGCAGQAAAAIAALMMAGMGSAAPEGRDQFIVVVSDYVGVPAGDLEHAVEVGRVNFLRAGVETSWRVCRRYAEPFEDCDLPLEGSYIQINVVSRLDLQSLGAPSSHLLGWARRESASDGRPIAYVFHGIAKGVADEVGHPLSAVLAWVMTHEAGHLLGLKHAASGVMRAHPHRQSVVDVRRSQGFAPSQAKPLRAGVSRLSAAAGAGTMKSQRPR